MRYPVKNFDFYMRGAPVVNGTPGTFIALLKATLIDGFGEASPVASTISNGECILTFAAGVTFSTDTVVLVSGANVISINNEQWVTANGTNSIRFRTLESDQTLMGDIRVRYAPVGSWTMPFSGDNVAVFRSTHPDASKIYFRIDDTQAKYATITMYKEMNDINTGYIQYPMSQDSLMYFSKSQTASAVARPWCITADEKTVYYDNNQISPVTEPNIIDRPWYNFVFGDFNAEGYANKQNALIIGGRETGLTERQWLVNALSRNTSIHIPRWTDNQNILLFENAGTQTGGAHGCITPIMNPFFNNVSQTSYSPAYGSGFVPSGKSINLPNRKIYLSDIGVYSSGYFIGRLPGVQYILNNLSVTFSDFKRNMFGTGKFSERKLMYHFSTFSDTYTDNSSTNLMSLASNRNQLVGFLDITGPW